MDASLAKKPCPVTNSMAPPPAVLQDSVLHGWSSSFWEAPGPLKHRHGVLRRAVCAHVEYSFMSAHTCTASDLDMCAFRGQRLVSRVFLNHSPPYTLRQGLTEPRVHHVSQTSWTANPVDPPVSASHSAKVEGRAAALHAQFLSFVLLFLLFVFLFLFCFA